MYMYNSIICRSIVYGLTPSRTSVWARTRFCPITSPTKSRAQRVRISAAYHLLLMDRDSYPLLTFYAPNCQVTVDQFLLIFQSHPYLSFYRAAIWLATPPTLAFRCAARLRAASTRWRSRRSSPSRSCSATSRCCSSTAASSCADRPAPARATWRSSSPSTSSSSEW